jgi:hypothetical protein
MTEVSEIPHATGVALASDVASVLVHIFPCMASALESGWI